MTNERVPLAIVVVNFASHGLLEQNLTRVAAQCPGDLVVVVDNFSTVDERRAVELLCSRLNWQLVAMSSNQGFGGGVNAGVARARDLGARAFLMLNPDAWIDGQSVRRLRRHVQVEPDCLVGPVIYDDSGALWSEGTYLYLDDGSMGSPLRHGARRSRPHLFWITGACFMVGDRLWQRVGGFNDRYFLYWEDVDLCFRVAGVGGRVAIDPEATAVHSEGGTQVARTSRAKSETYYYFNIRNRLLFARINLDSQSRRRWWWTSGQAARAIVLRGGRRQLIQSSAPIRAAVRGTLDGLRLAGASQDR